MGTNTSKTKDDNWSHDLTEAYLTGEMTEEEVRAEIARVRAEVSTVPGLQRSILGTSNYAQDNGKPIEWLVTF